jgi:hypothetical protein
MEFFISALMRREQVFAYKVATELFENNFFTNLRSYGKKRYRAVV